MAMKRTRDDEDSDLIPSCISILNGNVSKFGEDGLCPLPVAPDLNVTLTISDLNSKKASESLRVGPTLHDKDGGENLVELKERKKKNKRKKHRPKVVDIDNTKRMLGLPKSHETYKQKVSSRKEKVFTESLKDDQNDEFSQMAGNSDINLRVNDLVQELSMLSENSCLQPFLKSDLIQLNMESCLGAVQYIMDYISVSSLLSLLDHGRRRMARKQAKAFFKHSEGVDHSTFKVLKALLYVLNKFFPSLLLRNSSYNSLKARRHTKGGWNRKNNNGFNESREMNKVTTNAYSNFQIIPYVDISDSRSRLQQMEFSLVPTHAFRNFGYVNLTSTQSHDYNMELALLNVTENFKLMNINRECTKDSVLEEYALVPYFGGSEIVPYEPFGQIKQKRRRAKVELDSATNRVWKLLQVNGDGDLHEGMDHDMLKWWETERQVFIGRAKSFIARMNLILGDRQFSAWKGSVVDSVVGVFLTQNVSDHLSSSAFMSLAAKFPLHFKGDENKFSQANLAKEHEATSVVVANDPLEIQRKRHQENNLEDQSCDLQNSIGLTMKESSEISEEMNDMDLVGCPQIHSLNNTINAEKEAATGSSNDEKAYHVVEKSTSSIEKKENVEGEFQLDWEGLRRKVDCNGCNKERCYKSVDSVDWEAVHRADVGEISEAIRERGMNNRLAERIKDFLVRLVSDHGCIDLEWLRSICPDEAKKFLLSIRGLGLKSVECVRLLALQNVAFPVDTNVARISVRLGWVPLKPLPEFLQLHLLEQYPIMDCVQKYIWPRLCKLDHKTLYELHYHMITFGKVFCTKTRPNCSICPLRGECKHFNSSKKLALPSEILDPMPRLQYEENHLIDGVLGDRFDMMVIQEPPASYMVELPTSPLHESTQTLEIDIEDSFNKDDEAPAIELNMGKLAHNLQNLMQENDMKVPDNDKSRALIELSAEATSLPVRKLKNISGLRTEHHVYEVPDSHPLLKEMDKRHPGDPYPYLLAIWTPGETAESTEPPGSCCNSDILCDMLTCFSCNTRREVETQSVRGTLLIPCRTAMRGSFPLNGTYFHVNEVFADHESSRNPIHIPRSWLWNLPRRLVYFGTSVSAIFRGFSSIEPVKECFIKGFICLRGFDVKTRQPKPLFARLHLPRSKAPNKKKPWARQEEE